MIVPVVIVDGKPLVGVIMNTYPLIITQITDSVA